MSRNQGRYLSIGQLAALMGVANRSVSKMVDRGLFKDAFRLPGSADRRVPLTSALCLAREHGMVDAAREMERRAIELGLPVVIKPMAILLGQVDLSQHFPQFDVTSTCELFQAGALFASYSYDAAVVSGSLGRRECLEIARRVTSRPNNRTILGILMQEDWSDTGAWLDAGYRLAWKMPVDMEIVAGELYAACTTPQRTRRKARSR